MDPVQKIWLYENWLGDQLDKAELAKNHAYLLASFSHPEAVKQLLGKGNAHESTNAEFEESWEIVKKSGNSILPNNKSNRKRKRGTIKG